MSLLASRIRLRSLELGDADSLYRWENDLEAWESAGTLNPLSRHFVRDYIVRSATSLVEQGQLSLGVETLEGKLIGYVQLLDYNPIDRRSGVGIYIDRRVRRQGFARDALELVERYAGGKLGCRMLYAETLGGNKASSALFASLGYEHIATLPSWTWVDGAYQDLRYYQKWIN